MKRVDFVLIHPPSVYDFREKPVLWGPISDLVPSTTIFDMYPIGFVTIAQFLEARGVRVQILNLAVRMLNDENFNPETLISSLNTSAFGVDLHWLPHAHGAIEIAKIIKKYHPNIPVIFGGLSASYYHLELMKYPQIDYVVRGDSTELPVLQLIEYIIGRKKESTLEKIPNITYKNRSGIVKVNSLNFVPSDLDFFSLKMETPINSFLRTLNLSGVLPFKKWVKYPVVAGLTCKGCTHNCVVCGGSNFAYNRFLNRKKPVYRSPELLAEDIKEMGKITKGPIFIIGDIRQQGMDYAKIFLKHISGIKNRIIFEFFTPVSGSFAEQIADAVPNFVCEISPESHDPHIRRMAGKPFPPGAVERTIKNLINVGVKRIDLFFIIGLPGQDSRSVLEGVEFYEELLRKSEKYRKVKLFISPLAPFLDPGSLEFEKPDYFGYRKLCKTLEDHRKQLTAPSWKHLLSYSTRWMSRDEIVEATYAASEKLNKLKLREDLINHETFSTINEKIGASRIILKEIDKLYQREEMKVLTRYPDRHRNIIEYVNNSTLCKKEELDLPVGRLPFKPIRTAYMLLKELF